MVRDPWPGGVPQITMGEVVAESVYGPCPPGYKLVYVNGDGLDCRRANLRYVPVGEDWPEPEVVAVLDAGDDWS